jgi:archaellum component FlaF (FlaF/FlaG flagellin family)
MNTTMKHLRISVLLLCLPALCFGQITTNNTQTIQATITDLTNSWNVAEPPLNVLINGFDGTDISHPRVGLLSAPNSNFYFQEAMIIATKNIHISHCLAESDGITDHEVTADSDLIILSGTSELYNVTQVEFDFVANSDSIAFEFLFASREYSDDLCNANDDVAGIFVSGPGINGPFSNSAENIAKQLQHNLNVSVHNINNGQADPMNENVSSGLTCYFQPDSSQCPCFPQFFTDNGSGTGSDLHSELCFGGYTIPLVANVYLMPGETYTVKFVVANANADERDSALIISLDDFSAVNVAEHDPLKVIMSLFPNPVHGGYVNVDFQLPKPSDVEFIVFNSLGQHVFQEILGALPSGSHLHNLSGTTLPAGFYVVQLKTNAGIAESKLVVR